MKSSESPEPQASQPSTNVPRELAVAELRQVHGGYGDIYPLGGTKPAYGDLYPLASRPKQA